MKWICFVFIGLRLLHITFCVHDAERLKLPINHAKRLILAGWLRHLALQVCPADLASLPFLLPDQGATATMREHGVICCPSLLRSIKSHFFHSMLPRSAFITISLLRCYSEPSSLFTMSFHSTLLRSTFKTISFIRRSSEPPSFQCLYFGASLNCYQKTSFP